MSERIPDSEKLREDLAGLFGDTPEPSDELRAAVLEYGARRRRRSTAPRWKIPAAAATMVAAAVLVILVTRQNVPVPESAELPAAPAATAPMEKAQVAEGRMLRAAPLAGDLDGDGRVNVVDAWRMKHSIGTGTGQGDLDADGEVSPDDLDRLMQQIVAVRGGAS